MTINPFDLSTSSTGGSELAIRPTPRYGVRHEFKKRYVFNPLNLSRTILRRRRCTSLKVHSTKRFGSNTAFRQKDGTADSIKTSDREGVDRIDSIGWVYYAAILDVAFIVDIQHFVSHFIVLVRTLYTLKPYRPIIHACIQDDNLTLNSLPSSRT